MENLKKYLPYAFVALGILGASVGTSGANFAGEVCSGIIAVGALFYVALRDL